jgi:AraC-like DNA-binding protein
MATDPQAEARELLSSLQKRRPPMADDLGERGRPDRDRINVNEDYELRDWAKKFGVSPEEVRRAVQQVGDRADAVRQHLGK